MHMGQQPCFVWRAAISKKHWPNTSSFTRRSCAYKRGVSARYLAQEELAQLLGASRQRVNQEIKTMEREGAIRIEVGGLVVRDRQALMSATEDIA
jgi:DNA-binding transcriptional MocR family regulator